MRARKEMSHGVVEHNILSGQLQQHGIGKELGDADILREIAILMRCNFAVSHATDKAVHMAFVWL